MKIKEKGITLIAFLSFLLIGILSNSPIRTEQSIVHQENIAEHVAQKRLQNNEVEMSDFNDSDIISTVEEELHEHGTSIIEELYNRYDYYSSKLDNASEKERKDILLNLDKINQIISLYENQNLITKNKSIDTKIMNDSGLPAIFGISPNCTCNWLNYLNDTPCVNCQLYIGTLMEVNAIATLFSVREWSLASDLIMHNMSNIELDSDYTPSADLVNHVAISPQILEDVANLTQLTGGYAQTTPGRLNGLFENTIEGDVYNSLGAFFYNKSYAGDGMINISILDRYDWDRKDESPGGIIFNIMVTAQEIGVVTPFYTKMDITVPGTASLSWEYTNSGVSIFGAPKDIARVEIPNKFFDLRVRESSLPSVGVTSIDDFAFSNCTNLSQINIPESINSIGERAFENCSNLSMIRIPISVRIIGANCFRNCSSLTIYTKSIGKPLAWSINWNSSDRPVIWGDEDRTLYNDSITLPLYGYPSTYNDIFPVSKTITSQAGYEINTKRLRCGTINYDGKSYLTMSAKNKNSNQAYLEYYFTQYIIQIDYQLALWSSNESLILNSSIRLEALYNEEWKTLKTFSPTDMSTNKDLLLDYSTTLNEPTKAFRFIVDTSQVTNENNRGRVVIGNVSVEQIFDSHVHLYNYAYLRFTANRHTAFCECGDFALMPHAVGQIFLLNGHNYGYCVDCGELVDLGVHVIITPLLLSVSNEMIETPGEQTDYFYSDETYINEEGIIVLKESDVILYLTGELII